ncbi:cyclin-dependent kinase inhibitor 1-like [Rhopilema esculentum]|uniref:cyclin-dependent kinase inhibitor 1-like n=1 Tax=Rhopilema esculentum TaxID=499914 RepID=UPI0031DA4AFA
MEAIPITNCSSTLPSLSRGVIPSKRLCRNLFGPVDHEEVKSVLDQELIEEQQQKCEEWCFDFSEGTPILNGRLVWEEIAERKEYVLSPEPQKPVSEERRVPNLHEEQESKDKDVFDKPQKAVVRPSTTKSPEIVKITPAVTNETEANKLKVPSNPDRKRKKQYKTITDFMKQKKRRRVSYSNETEKTGHSKMADSSRGVQDDLALGSPAKKVRVWNGTGKTTS